MDSQDKEENLFPVRCPILRLSKTDGKLYRCNSLCVRVNRGSGGEARCRKCHLSFDFTCDDTGTVSTFVTPKPIK